MSHPQVFFFFLIKIFFWHVRSQFPCPGREPTPPTVEAQTPNHWTAREVPHPQVSVVKWQMTTCTHTIHRFACKNDSFHINHRIYLIQIKHETRITFGPYQVAITLFKKKKKKNSTFLSTFWQSNKAQGDPVCWGDGSSSHPQCSWFRGVGETQTILHTKRFCSMSEGEETPSW